MKYQVGDLFVELNTKNTSNIGLLISIKEQHAYQYYIDWTNGSKGHYTKNEILNWIEDGSYIHLPVKK